MKTKQVHTKKPWKIKKGSTLSTKVFIIAEKPYTWIADVYVDGEIGQANARLIAESPLMYKLLLHIVNHDPNLPCGFCISEAKLIKARIDLENAKAEGQEGTK